MKKPTLNATQVLHISNPCSGRKCAFPGCSICLCDKRIDSKFCSDEHKAQKNNIDIAQEDYQMNQRKKLNKQNIVIIEDVYDRDYRQLDLPALKLTGFNFEVAPLGGIVRERKVALYGKIALWVDSDLIVHLEKI